MDTFLVDLAEKYLSKHQASFSQYVQNTDLYLSDGTMNISEIANIAKRDFNKIVALVFSHDANRILHDIIDLIPPSGV